MGSAINALLGKKKEEKKTVKKDSAISRLLSEKKEETKKPSSYLPTSSIQNKPAVKSLEQQINPAVRKPSVSSVLSPNIQKMENKTSPAAPNRLISSLRGVSNIGKTVGGFATDVITSIPKSGVQLGLYASNKITGKNESSYKPQDRVGKALLGTEVKDAATTGKEFARSLGFSEKTAGKYGPTAGVVLAMADLIPGSSGKKSVVKCLAKEKDVAKVSKMLTKAGMKADEIAPYAQKIAKTSDTKVIESTLKEIDSLAKKSSPLIQEAKKYKSAEEFALGKMKETKPSELLDKKSFESYFVRSPHKTTSQGKTRFGQDIEPSGKYMNLVSGKNAESAPKNLEKGVIKFENPLVIENVSTDNNGWKKALSDMFNGKTGDDLSVAIRRQGYDGIVTVNSKHNYIDEVVSLGAKEDVFKSKSQLTDIWNEANKTAKTSQKTTAQNALRGVENGKVIDDTLEAGTKERGFIKSVKETKPEISKVAGQYIPRSTDELAIKAKNLIKSDITTAEKVAFAGNDENAVATAAELIKHYSDEAVKAADQATKNALYDKSASVANDIARKLTEQGRSVQAASILGRLTPEGQVRFAAREIQKYNEAVDKASGGLLGIKKKVPELSGSDAQKILDEMKAIQEMPEGMEKAMKFKELQDFISDLVPGSLMNKAITIWKAGLLTGIKTSGLNIFSNTSHLATETIKDIPAEVIDRAISLLTGKRTVSASLRGTLSGGVEGAEKGMRYLKTGYSERDIATKLDFKRANIKNRVLKAYTDSVFRILGSEDQPFYYAAKARSLYEQAKVAAINKKLKGKEAQSFIDDLMANPTEDMIKYASKDAETAVFQNKTKLGEASKAIQKIGGGAGEIIVPFGRTPSAVAMQIVNYSPVGAVKTIVENIGKGRFDQRAFSQGLGRAITGTGVLYIGAELYKKGMVSLDRPTTEKERKLWELEGRKANSIKIGNKWRSIQTFGPAGNLLVVGGQFQKSFEESGSPSAAMSTAIAGGAKSFTESTFLQGVSGFTEALMDPEKSAPYFVNRTIASVIPTIVSDAARSMDSKERRVNYKKMSEPFKARVPGLRETLQPQVDVLGNEIERIGNPLEVMIDPTRPQQEKTSPVISEIRRLWDEGYKVTPTLLGDKNGYSSLTPEQNTELWKRSGQILDGKLNNLFKHEKYAKLSDEEKAKKVEDFTEKAKVVARAEKVLELTEGLQGDELKTKLSELKKDKLLTRDVFNRYKELR